MELQILHWFESLHNNVLNPIFYAITVSSNHGEIWILLAICCLFLFPKKYRKNGITIALALIFSVIMCNLIMKNAFHRVRPFVTDPTFENLYGNFDKIHDWSFPSGHTSASFAAAFAFILWDRKKGIFVMVYAALITFSRLYLTAHYPTDVLTSLILGSLYGIAAYFIMKWVFSKSQKMNSVFIKENSYKELFKKNAV